MRGPLGRGELSRSSPAAQPAVGGGKINGSFLAAGLVDELSLLVAPVADGSIGAPSLFDAREGKGPARSLRLLSVERRPGDLVWLRYRMR